ncbi:hypothetical protein ACKS23_07090 [Histoplasma ohiense]
MPKKKKKKERERERERERRISETILKSKYLISPSNTGIIFIHSQHPSSNPVPHVRIPPCPSYNSKGRNFLSSTYTKAAARACIIDLYI